MAVAHRVVLTCLHCYWIRGRWWARTHWCPECGGYKLAISSLRDPVTGKVLTRQ